MKSVKAKMKITFFQEGIFVKLFMNFFIFKLVCWRNSKLHLKVYSLFWYPFSTLTSIIDCILFAECGYTANIWMCKV